MGGLIITNLATDDTLVSRNKIKGLVLLNTPVFFWDIKRVLINIFNDFRTKSLVNIMRYLNGAKIPMKSMIDFQSILKKTKPIFSDICVPTFIAQGLKDDAVKYKSAKFIYDKIIIKQKNLIYYKNSGHLICASEDKDMLFVDILLFVNSILTI